MTPTSPNLRKAAVLIRSLDGETAARLLAQLAPADAREIQAAIRDLGYLDPDEQADVLAEFRRAAPLANQAASLGVELQLSSALVPESDRPDSELPIGHGQPTTKRFDFLDDAPAEALAQFLAREHAQTIAVVLSYLAPRRAALVLAALPPARRAETVERLSALGDTDPDSVSAVERELSDWFAQRDAGRAGNLRRGDAVVSILAAADEVSRREILYSVKSFKAPLAEQLAPLMPATKSDDSRSKKVTSLRNTQADGLGPGYRETEKTPAPQPSIGATRPVTRPVHPPLPQICFDDLAALTNAELAAVLREADANVLLLALAGSSDELVDRICKTLPRRTANAIRRKVARLGPTRLSDVESAQRVLAAAAARYFVRDRSRGFSATAKAAS